MYCSLLLKLNATYQLVFLYCCSSIVLIPEAAPQWHQLKLK